MVTIDIFTTPKPFTGLTAIHQANALRSWRGCPQVRRIFVFGAVSGETDVIAETGAEVVLDVECTDNGLPSIRSMFEIAAERSEADLLMFTNADMIYLPSFFSTVEDCRAAAGESFLFVGSRIDFDSERVLSFDSPADIAAFESDLESAGKVHPPAGSDYFIFPRRQYLENRLPDLWIGRGGWDLYMIYHAKLHGFPSVDVSPSAWGYHQNHDYSLRGKEEGITYEKDPEAVYNLSLLPEGKSWGEWTLAGCKMEWIAGVMKEKPPLNVPTFPKKRAGERRRKSGGPRRRDGKRSKWAFLMRPFRRLKRYLFGGNGPGNAPRNDKSPRADSAEVVRAELIKVARLGGPLNLVIGAATTQYDDWISTNINSLNLLVEEDWSAILGELRLDRVLAEHVWEHLSPADGIAGLKNVAAYLKPGGRVRIAVPDGHFPDSEYIAYVKPGGHGPGADDHKILYTVETMAAAMREAGLIPVPLENFDAKGEFCSRDWDPADGKVIRSVRFDSRNQGGILKYTSLIMDGMKPE